ncbi:Protein CBG01196 [Caenorhabditis briggsae]|uniref:Protein CBG01196 n=1 Tax=Caenorhabditis briggsae TaxID=6238 RepID=A8WPT5_CAEBR|nr:Protein CBG01196 [Caenorhabditis briggsae]CAP22492.1 Protein CBG01196 [Caenorhabditis briggsae]
MEQMLAQINEEQLVGNLVEVVALVWDFVDRLVEEFLPPLLEQILQKITTGVVRHKIPEPLDDQFREEGDLVEELAEVYQFVNTALCFRSSNYLGPLIFWDL